MEECCKNWEVYILPTHYPIPSFTEQGHLPQILEEGACFSNLKEAEKATAANFQPVSFICVTCNVMEHIILTSQLTRFAAEMRSSS